MSKICQRRKEVCPFFDYSSSICHVAVVRAGCNNLRPDFHPPASFSNKFSANKALPPHTSRKEHRVTRALSHDYCPNTWGLDSPPLRSRVHPLWVGVALPVRCSVRRIETKLRTPLLTGLSGVNEIFNRG